MAKRLFLVSAALLMLAVAYHLGSRDAQAQSGSYFRMLGSGTASANVAVGDEVWGVVNGQTYWEHLTGNDLPPVPVSSLVFYNYQVAITDAGEGWINRNFNTWVSIGPVPGGTVNVQPETWSGVKEKYR